jgi:hypothetical protein
MKINLPVLHPAQRAIYEDTSRFRVVSKGRRFGGSLLGVVECLAEMLNGGYAWLVTPTIPNSRDRWAELKGLARQIPGTTIREVPLTISYANGGQLAVKSAEMGDTLRGSGLTLIVADEFAYWQCDQAYVWVQILRPMLSTTNGRALFLSSPNGLDYFHLLFLHEGELTGWRSFTCKTADNPYVPAAEIASMRAEMTAQEALQELDAAFIDLTGSVFRRVTDNATAEPQDRAIPGHTYVIGVDLAKSLDFSVFAVVDTTLAPPSLVYLDRQNHVDYSVQVNRLKALCERFQPGAVIVETNNAGSAVLEQMRAVGIAHLQALTTTNATKAAQVEALQLAFERDAIRLIPDKVLLAEMGTFTASKLPSGLMKYAAIGRNHDDTVLALMLAWAGVTAKPNTVHAAPNPFYTDPLGFDLYRQGLRGETLTQQIQVAQWRKNGVIVLDQPVDHLDAGALCGALPPGIRCKRVQVCFTRAGGGEIWVELYLNREPDRVVCPRCWSWVERLDFSPVDHRIICPSCKDIPPGESVEGVAYARL